MSAEPRESSPILAMRSTGSTPTRRRTARLGHALAAGALVLLPGCSWFTDFKQQPKIDPWESTSDTVPPRAQPQGSVPITGALVPAWQVSYRPMPQVVDSMSGLANPVAPDDASLANGRKYYAINCAVCHGDNGNGQGPATKYGMVPISLLTGVTQARTDGYIWGMIRNGRGIMPNYNRIEEMDRWDVVNYVRGLQGRLGRQVPIGPLAAPGVGGNALPGATRLGPTRPVPHWGDTRTAQTGIAGQRRPAAPSDSASPATGGAPSVPGEPSRTPAPGGAAGTATSTGTATATPRGNQP